MKGTLHADQYTFMITSRLVLLRMRNVTDNVIEIIKIHILCPVTFFENHAVYETMWKNIAGRGRPQIAIWRMRIACLIHIKVVIFIFTYMYL